MNVIYVFLFLALLVGGFALPTPEVEDDLSIFFEHADLNARIVGGTQAAIASHPHMVGLSGGLLIRSFICGGSLITTRTVLSAAHCIGNQYSFGSLSTSLRATVGTNFWNQGGTAYSLSRNVTHPNYVSGTIKNDLVLLITSSNVVLSDVVRTIPLNYNWVGAGVQTRVAGWGRIRTNGALSTSLLEISVPTIDGDHCVRAVAQASIDFNVCAPPVEPLIEICTFHAEGTGTCNGDSGSALARVDNGQQVGIVSWGFPCARGAPDMFVRVSVFQSWIQQNLV